MTKDTLFLQEAYTYILEKKKAGKDWVPPWAKKEDEKGEKGKKCKCKAAGHGCDCDDCSECKANQKKEKGGSELTAKQKKLPPALQAAMKKRMTKKNGLEEAYMEIFESKHINKKFARRYNKITSLLLKADPGSKDYTKLKTERDDLVSILKDHGKTPADLDELLAKKEPNEEMEQSEENEPTLQYNDVCTRCGDCHKVENCPENI
jgi:hypothetical protein